MDALPQLQERLSTHLFTQFPTRYSFNSDNPPIHPTPPRHSFKSDWFHRLAGFFLDLMAVAAISSMRFDYYKKARFCVRTGLL